MYKYIYKFYNIVNVKNYFFFKKVFLGFNYFFLYSGLESVNFKGVLIF